ncbi:MAG: TIGR03545 family protein [Nitrospirae bacterium]|nr:TIGR03545 family protein [Nitrospirota bacterium]
MNRLGRFIRWRGLAAFVVLVTALTLGWLLLVDRMVKAGFEAAGTRAVGARVDVGGADLSLFPAGLTLTRIQVTDPDAPMTNAVEIARVAMTMDGALLLRRKVIVEEMAVEGVRLHTPRSRSGAIHKAPKPAREADHALFGLALPDPDALLREARLEALQAADALKADLAAFRASWEKQIAELPDDDDLKAYRERIKALQQARKGGIGAVLGAVKEVKALQDDIRADAKAVRDARQRFHAELAQLQARRKALQDAPAAEARRLVTRFAHDAGLEGTLTTLAFTERVSGWVTTTHGWYQRLRPYIDRARAVHDADGAPARGTGQDIRFPETHPLPDLLVRRASVSVQLAAGDLAGTVTNLTPDPSTLGRPLVFRFTGDRLRGIDRVAVEGTLDHVRPDAPRDRLAITVNGYRADGLALVPGGPLPLTLARGRVDLAVHATVAGGDRLAGRLALGLRDARLEAEGSPAVARALQGVKAVNAQATLGGTLAHPTVDVSTNLDDLLRAAAAEVARQRLETLEADVRQRLAQRLRERLGDADPDGLAKAIGDHLAARAGGLDEILAGVLTGRP